MLNPINELKNKKSADIDVKIKTFHSKVANTLKEIEGEFEDLEDDGNFTARDKGLDKDNKPKFYERKMVLIS